MGISKELLERIIKFKEYFDYSEEESAKILKKKPELLNLSKIELDNKLKTFALYGWGKSQIKKMLLTNPNILTMNKDDLLEKILAYKDLKLDYCIENYPNMLNCPIKDLKFKYMLSVIYKMDFAFFPYSTSLGLQSVEKTYARLNYLLKTNKDVRDEIKDIFISEKEFVDKHLVSTEQLKITYPLTMNAINLIATRYDVESHVNPNLPKIELSEEEKSRLIFKMQLKDFRKILKSQKENV